ncbi:MAG: permease, partial [Cetobacterium sp.]|uniref:permease n=1 Tax=Cetobacterium sp. TaxID=2071632 RepID=UPI002FC5C658
ILLGTITPFCSCSNISLFIGFTSAGLPNGVTFSFLISLPLVDIEIGEMNHRDRFLFAKNQVKDIFKKVWLPIAEALYLKGVGIGTILALMMSVTALSFPSMVMLSKVIKFKLLASYVGLVTTGILIIGYLFNFINI